MQKTKFPYRFSAPVNSRIVISVLGLLPGERLLVRYVAFGDCGKELGIIDYHPNCCKIYLGECINGQVNTGNPIQLNTFNGAGLDMPGTYELVPETPVGANVQVVVNFMSETV
jgi:hypothetical protein